MTSVSEGVSASNPDGSPTTSAPAFLITIDTEEDNAWSRPRVATTRNARFLERFQELCERYGQRPTWLVSYEMIRCSVFRAFATDVLSRGTAEVGMHLHAWNTPPLEPLTADDTQALPYLVEYEPRLMREKVHALTATIEDRLGTNVVSHRAGRWAFDERYAEILLAEGYRVDCSVTPLINWKTTLGDPAGSGGSDYSAFPRTAYWVDLDDISLPGVSELLEVPVTIDSLRSGVTQRVASFADRLPSSLGHVGACARRLMDRVSPRAAWLRPNGNNRHQLCELIERVVAGRGQYAEFMLHSSELMPGGSPTFPDSGAIENLYADLEVLFEAVSGRFRGMTLAEFHSEMLISSRLNA